MSRKVLTQTQPFLHYFKVRVGQTTNKHFLELLWIPDMGPDPASDTRALVTNVPWEPVAFQTLIFVTEKHYQQESKLCASCH